MNNYMSERDRHLCEDAFIRATWDNCLLYTSDAADEGLGVDLGGRRIIKKKIYNATSGSVN